MNLGLDNPQVRSDEHLLYPCIHSAKRVKGGEAESRE